MSVIVALAIESNISLSNCIVVADNPDDAVEKLIAGLEMFQGEEICLICADVLRSPTLDGQQAEEFRRTVEVLFEESVPELFTAGYFAEEE